MATKQPAVGPRSVTTNKEAPSAPRHSIVPLSPRLRGLLVKTPYKNLITQLGIMVGVFGGLGVVLDYPIASALAGLTLIAVLAWLRGEALLDAWADSSESRRALNDRLREYRRALSDLGHRYRDISKFQEKILIRYWIGQKDDEDRVQCESITQSVSPDHSVLWRTVAFGATGEAVGGYTFEDAGFHIEVEGSSLDFLPLEEGNLLRGMAIFSPEIQTEPRKWYYSYSLNGLWAPLRSSLTDNSIYQIETKGVEEVELRFIFPSNRKGRFLNFPKEGKTRDDSDQGRFALCWRIESPHRRPYYFTIQMDQ